MSPTISDLERVLTELSWALDPNVISDSELTSEILVQEIEMVIDHLLANLFPHWADGRKVKAKELAMHRISTSHRQELVSLVNDYSSSAYPRKKNALLAQRILSGVLFCFLGLIFILFVPFIWYVDWISWMLGSKVNNGSRSRSEISRYEVLRAASRDLTLACWAIRPGACCCCNY